MFSVNASDNASEKFLLASLLYILTAVKMVIPPNTSISSIGPVKTSSAPNHNPFLSVKTKGLFPQYAHQFPPSLAGSCVIYAPKILFLNFPSKSYIYIASPPLLSFPLG